ncbi:MAG: hypothetical protein GY780_10870 [bacterium]|nr:hypothetical protein [bacterium]
MQKSIISCLLFLLIASGSMANPELSSSLNTTKTNSHIGLNPGIADARQGGEDIASAIVIESLPFVDTGNTSDNIDDYDFQCPYGPSSSPDVVYSYTPSADQAISVDLCGSGYDTKTFIFDSSLNMIACNDDFYSDEICGQYVSFIDLAYLNSGETYYIIIDGYGGDSGDYQVEILDAFICDLCHIEAPDDEGEPELVDGYIDSFNNGCGGNSGNFSILTGSGTGELEFGGDSGWYVSSDGTDSRDTDWFLATIGPEGIIEWTMDAEVETYGFLLGPNDCNDVAVLGSILSGPCIPQTLTIQGTPGDIVWLWIGPVDFTGPPGFSGHEYNYICNFTGLWNETVSTEKVSLERVKSLYR